jgi:hypothetical protein
MRYISLVTSIGLICLLVLAGSCKKSSSAFNFNTAVTASLGGSTQQYLIPSGFVNTTNGNYTASGYQSSATSNTIVLAVDTPETGNYTLSAQNANGNYVMIVNNSTSYSSLNNFGPTAGIISLTVTGSTVKGTFSGTLYAGPSSVNKDSLVVTNGTISTTY